ncbi:unnamed protein product [Aureobasidium pullulans]|uniref:2-dehydropantoate 2-reductase n=1 Tax=Aureobasidium pullulans TaxID=5580 RepID=A0A4S9PLI9_AURPU|nr:2-dehydropantoate 2-reductase family protein [Aureobasidium pullulans]THZ44149.1 2-dehydropantoate 2-reductase family protein [Aureobasidium pullulans]THZ58015.1 2-dehydropantoate 2-reductase family protein [Aureobasidium pullulans]CAD0015981.1 unnamed protein product [Aureobasidium pullulans]CAD0027601.1 unnamed protein product [Aureobasidium pullulans]
MAQKKHNILLIGAGGVGTIAALNLERGSRADVTVVLRSNYQKVADDGFTIDSVDHGSLSGWRPSRLTQSVPTADEQRFDYIVCTTKNIPDSSTKVVDLIAPAVIPGHTVVVLVQNGLNIEKPIFERFPQNIVLSGVSMIGSTETSHGVIKHLDPDELLIGAFHNPNLDMEVQHAAAREFIEIYSAGGKTQCEFVPNVPFSRWRKLVYNACLNSTCAITGLDTGRLRIAGSPIKALVRPAMEEIKLAANASGVTLPDDVAEKMMDILEPISDFFAPSMLVDVRKGNLTEFENIVGEPLRDGTRNGVDMPTIRTLYGLLEALQWRLKEAKGLVEAEV